MELMEKADNAEHIELSILYHRGVWAAADSLLSSVLMYGVLLNNSSLSAGQPTERKKPPGVILCTVGFKWLHKRVTQHLSSILTTIYCKHLYSFMAPGTDCT